MDLTIAKSRIASVMKKDSITASQGDFLATHVGIKKLMLLNRFEFSPNINKFTSEEDVYKQLVLNPENRHQFIIVYGQSGTGKSHLIRWFDARYQADRPENEVVLFVRRSDNTLKGTIRQLLEKPEVQGIADKAIIKRLADASTAVPEAVLKDMIYHNFIIEINNDNGDHELQLNNVKKKRLVAFLNNEVIHDHMMEFGGPIERIYSKVAENASVDPDVIAKFTPDDFIVSVDLYESMQQAGADPKADKMARALMANDAMEDARKFADYFNQFIETVIQRCAGIEPGDFEQVFMAIRKELFRLGKNLTLFIEDITSFTGVDRALLNALVEEHNDRDICRISSIVGGTNSYINDIRANYRDRATRYVYIPDDAFDENGIFEFVGRYLNTMSLPESIIEQWVEDKALPQDYPIHVVKEGGEWEYISISKTKKLCLYPFTKHSILYLYNNELSAGNQTPRYIIRDIIEPVVNDLIYHADTFPSIEYNIVNLNTKLSYAIHSQIKDSNMADRLLRFMSIWGNNDASQFEYEGIKYISGIPEKVYTELKLSIPNLQQGSQPVDINKENDSKVSADGDKTIDPSPLPEVNDISVEAQKKLDDANVILSQWANGTPIDLSTTGGITGAIRAARDDIGEFAYSLIDWQTEGVSMDNVSKVRAATKGTRMKLIAFENQTASSGFYALPANWESINLINAAIRWREFGGQSWKYNDSDFDVYLITSWIFKVKNALIKAVREYSDGKDSKYIEAAMSAEIYRLILNGEYREKNLNGLTTENLLVDHSAKGTNNSHSKEWNALISVINQKNAGKINQETVRQYFKLIQGDSSSKIAVLDARNLSKVLRRVKTNKLQLSDDDMQSDDRVKLRKDSFILLEEISKRINVVAKAELDAARQIVQPIYDCFDDDDIEDTDIRKFLELIVLFYKEIDNTQINIKTVETDSLKRKAGQMAKAIGDIGNILDSDDSLEILMAFSGDPISVLQPLLTLIQQVSNDITKLDNQIALRKSKLGNTSNESDRDLVYKTDLERIETDFDVLEALR